MFTEGIESFSMLHLRRTNGIATDDCHEFYYQLDTSDIESLDEPLPILDSGATTLPAPTPSAGTRTFRVQDSFSVSRSNNVGDCIVREIMSKETLNLAFDGTLSLDHQMSIFIKRLDLCDSNETFPYDDGERNNETTEKTTTSNALFCKQQRARKSLLQKYFVNWAHFNKIEKLTRRNPDQTRLKKMKIFLQDLSSERKKTLQNLKVSLRNTTKPTFSTDSYELPLTRKFE